MKFQKKGKRRQSPGSRYGQVCREKDYAGVLPEDGMRSEVMEGVVVCEQKATSKLQSFGRNAAGYGDIRMRRDAKIDRQPIN